MSAIAVCSFCCGGRASHPGSTGSTWLYSEEGLTLRKRRACRKAVGSRAPILVEVRPNANCSLDFVHEEFANGRRFRILNIGRRHHQEMLGAIPETSISGRRVARALTAIVEQRGKPGMIVFDHGTEFTCNAMLAWCKDAAIDWRFIAPGKPMQNGFVESFMYRPPRDARGFSSTLNTGRVRSCIQPVGATDAFICPHTIRPRERGRLPHQWSDPR
ncbi:transposase InsO family protein [Bradyrhizobium japonicum]